MFFVFFFTSPWVTVLQLFKVHGKTDYRDHSEMLEISTFYFHLLGYLFFPIKSIQKPTVL